MQRFDAIVVGAGHAGIEAIRALSAMGKSVVVVTLDKSKIGAMSCNPAIGGVAKSHLVFEIDAMGGLMGQAADASSIQSRRLNLNKGPAVRSTRVQCDKDLYRQEMVRRVHKLKNVTVVESEAAGLLVENKKVVGVRLSDGSKIHSRAVLITAGTFMRGLMFCGEQRSVGGRFGDEASKTLSLDLVELGHRIKRLKTGTPARLDAKSINFSKLQRQWGDPEQRRFSWHKSNSKLPQLSCFLTYTNEKTHEVIRKNFDKSPLFSGDISGIGPRYCPSIEDKVKRFADRGRHQIFLEPEGLNTDFIYPNGMSTSLPEDVQLEFLRTIEGLENVELKRAGYAVEYDSIDPTELNFGFMSKHVEGLFLAGQVNRTSGYEEAASQGLWAGLNAGRFIDQKDALRPDRSRSYMETLVEDLVLRGTEEPYRLFTSRSEYRLLLREDNAQDRMLELAREHNMLSSEQILWHEARLEMAFNAKKDLLTKKIRLSQDRVISLFEWLKRPEISWESFCVEHSLDYDDNVVERLEVEAKYSGYLQRQESELEQLKKADSMVFVEGFNISEVPAVSSEIIEKFKAHKPKTVYEFSRISGVTPAAVLALMGFMKRPASGVSRETIGR